MQFLVRLDLREGPGLCGSRGQHWGAGCADGTGPHELGEQPGCGPLQAEPGGQSGAHLAFLASLRVLSSDTELLGLWGERRVRGWGTQALDPSRPIPGPGVPPLFQGILSTS